MRASLLLILLTGCLRDFKRFDTSSDCTVGDVTACICDNGAAGSRTCGENLQFSACDCVSVRISPDRATVTAGSTLQFTALVSEEGNTWTASAGAIDANGLFTAPQSAGTVTVRAVSTKSPARSADALVTVASAPVTPDISFMPMQLLRGAQGVVATITEPLPDLIYDWSVSGGEVTSSTRGDHIVFNVISESSVFISVTATNAANARGIAAIVSMPVFAMLTPQATPAIRLPASITQGRRSVRIAVANPINDFDYLWTVGNGAIMSGASTSAVVFVDVEEGVTGFDVSVIGRSPSGQETPATTVKATVAPRAYERLAGQARGSGTVDGVGTDARFTAINAMTLGPDGKVYVSDEDRLRVLNPATREVTTIATGLTSFQDIAVSPSGEIALIHQTALQTISPTGARASTGLGAIYATTRPSVTYDGSGNLLYTYEDGTSTIIKQRTPLGVTSNFHGSTTGCNETPGGLLESVSDLAFRAGKIWALSTTGASSAFPNTLMMRRIDSATSSPTVFGTNCLSGVVGATFANSGAFSIAFADSSAFVVTGRSVHRIDDVDTTPTDTFVAGVDGFGPPAGSGDVVMLSPHHVVTLPSGILISGAASTEVLQIDNPYGIASEAFVRSVFGATEPSTPQSRDGDALTQAEFFNPHGGAFSASGDLFIADMGNRCVRTISDGAVSTLAGACAQPGQLINGPAAAARFSQPTDIARSPDGAIYVADVVTNDNGQIRKISNGFVSSFVGASNGAENFDGPRTSIKLRSLESIAIDSTGRLYFSDAQGSGKRLRVVIGDDVFTIAGKTNACTATGAIAPTAGSEACLGNTLRNLVLANDKTMYALTGEGLVRISLESPFNVESVCFGVAQTQVPGGNTSLGVPVSFALRGETVYALFTNNQRLVLYKFDLTSCAPSLVVGALTVSGNRTGPLASASLAKPPPGQDYPTLHLSPDGDIVIVDTVENAIFRVRD